MENEENKEPKLVDNTNVEDNEPLEEEEVVVLSGPFAFLEKGVEYLDEAWEHAKRKDDFDKMITVVNRVLDMNDRYMAVMIAGEEEVEHERPKKPFGFSTDEY